jgi:xanthine dehydrogenase accessory factor
MRENLTTLRVDKHVISHLYADMVEENLLKRVHAPIGLNLGGRQPAEVVLAILTEIEMVRHHGLAEPKGIHA